VMQAEARTQYRNVIKKMEPATPAEESLQKHVAENKCASCHVPKTKNKQRTTYGQSLHDALGGGSKDDYSFDKKAWKKDKETKQYPSDLVEKLRKAINDATEKPGAE